MWIHSHKLIFAAVPLFALYVFWDRRKHPEENPVKYFFWTTFFIYFLGFLHYTIFPLHLDPSIEAVAWIREFGGKRAGRILSEVWHYGFRIGDLKLFFTQDSFREHFLLNVLLTVPWGMLLPCLKPSVCRKGVLLRALQVGIGIEFVQLLFNLLGVGMHTFDILDCIANAGGVLLGYAAFLAVFRLLSRHWPMVPGGGRVQRWWNDFSVKRGGDGQ